jgi:predicted acyl esterase
MNNSYRRMGLAIAVVCAISIGGVRAQQGTPLTQEQKDQRVQTEKELESVAIIERKVMIPMRDGVRLATDIYRPKNASGPVPIIWVRTPYNFNFWDVRNGLPADMKAALTAVKRGYAYVVQNERGHFFSEGNYDILGAPRTDGTDMLDWLKAQPWTNGRAEPSAADVSAEYFAGRFDSRFEIV